MRGGTPLGAIRSPGSTRAALVDSRCLTRGFAGATDSQSATRAVHD